jgi:hypothetical protein
MYEILKKELDKDQVFSGKLPPIITDLANSIDNYKIPYRMKLAFAVSEFILFFSQFQKKIELAEDNLIPINAITFCISGSGNGKDSAKSAVRNCFGSSYQAINNKRKENAKRRAIEMAREEGLDNPDTFDVYKTYYRSPNSLFSAPDSTLPGLTGDFNRLEEEGLGAGFIYSGEIGDELSKGMEDLMQFMSEVYDSGNKEAKAVKDKSLQLQPLENFAVSALFGGSPTAILHENHTKEKFKKAFGSKLARRSYFMFTFDEGKRPNFTTIEQIDEWMENNERLAKEAKQKAALAINAVTERLLNTPPTTIKVSKEVSRVFKRYMLYNEELADQLDHQYAISKLVRKHLQWKALKFAGAIAAYNGHKEITLDDYIVAISYGEMLDEDMQEFEKELSKQPHEVFADLINTSVDPDGKASMSFHTIKKVGFIPSTGNTDQHVKNLIQLASSYDEQGIYTIDNNDVHFEKQRITDISSVSYLPIDNTKLFELVATGASTEAVDIEKHRIASTTTYGYEYMDTTFADLGIMLEEDFAYTPFKLRQADEDAVYDKDKHPNAVKGVRGRENVLGGCKWIVIDVDKSAITATECHLMLSDINHHIALTSDENNENKFRVLIELDSVVEVSDQQWKLFIQFIAEYLAIHADPLPKSQIFFSYSGRDVLSTIDAEPLEAKPFILRSSEAIQKKERPKKLTQSQAKVQLNDPLTTFEYAYEAEDGEGSRSMVRAALHAKDLGATQEQCEELMYDINDYWAYPMDQGRFERTIITYVERIYLA